MNRSPRPRTVCLPRPARSMARRRRGIFQVEVLLALLIIGLLLTALTTASARQDKVLRRFAAQRAALRLAETALANLQAGAASAEKSVLVRRLATEPPAAGFIWVEVTTVSGGQSARLVGLVPANTQLPPEVPLEKR